MQKEESFISEKFISSGHNKLIARNGIKFSEYTYLHQPGVHVFIQNKIKSDQFKEIPRGKDKIIKGKALKARDDLSMLVRVTPCPQCTHVAREGEYDHNASRKCLHLVPP